MRSSWPPTGCDPIRFSVKDLPILPCGLEPAQMRNSCRTMFASSAASPPPLRLLIANPSRPTGRRWGPGGLRRFFAGRRSIDQHGAACAGCYRDATHRVRMATSETPIPVQGIRAFRMRLPFQWSGGHFWTHSFIMQSAASNWPVRIRFTYSIMAPPSYLCLGVSLVGFFFLTSHPRPDSHRPTRRPCGVARGGAGLTRDWRGKVGMHDPNLRRYGI